MRKVVSIQCHKDYRRQSELGRGGPWGDRLEDICPVSPKAIFTRNVEVTDRWGATILLKRPYIDPNKCIGCGIREHECPVKDDPAVYVTAIGETRDKSRSLLLSLVDGQGQEWVSI